ncbi:MAG: DoxX family protein [Cytophagales bacterium]|nr:DoxX family protein [Armatimonadota bacterium]
MKTKQIGYWATTGILAFALLLGGVGDLTHQPVIDAGMAHLGYPRYFATILGFWKIPGAIVLLAPRLPRLKEWAYAGAFFNMTGAVVSHITSGDTFFQFLSPLIFAVCAIVSWALRPSSRVLGVLFPPERAATEGGGGGRKTMASGTV